MQNLVFVRFTLATKGKSVARYSPKLWLTFLVNPLAECQRTQLRSGQRELVPALTDSPTMR
ncbi:hypothetical protein D9M72_267420 [compost metagenome]